MIYKGIVIPIILTRNIQNAYKGWTDINPTPGYTHEARLIAEVICKRIE